MKALRGARTTEPPAPHSGRQDRWARPLEFSGECLCRGGRGWRLRRGPFADQRELSDPARRVLLRADRRVVDVRVDVRLAPRQQHVDQADHLVRQRDDRLLVRFAHHQAFVLRAERALGHARGIGALALRCCG